MGRKWRSADVISLLVQIFGSRDLFANDRYAGGQTDHRIVVRYRQRCAVCFPFCESLHLFQRALCFSLLITGLFYLTLVIVVCLCFHCWQIRTLEMLKLRFGESLLHNCAVMLKDVADSKRVNTYVSQQTAEGRYVLTGFLFSCQ